MQKLFLCLKLNRLYLFQTTDLSLSPIFSKGFERLMYDRLIAFISRYNLLTPNQYGFQVNKSTELAINEICSSIKYTFENKETALCIFLDFAKAFDTVNHEILLKKLEYYGIRGSPLSWLKNYLNKRQQYTEVGDTLSDIDDIHCGVPQGSILGPLIFLIYINDIVSSSKILKFYLFADDTTIFYSTKIDAKTEQTLNTELNKVNNWLNCNKLSLNVGKSSYLKFTNIRSTHNVTIKMANRPIDQKRVAKYLGVLIDDNLSWKYHIDNINLKIRKGIGMLNKVKSMVLASTLKTLYYSFISPYLDYNIINWSSAPNSYINILNNSNKKIVRNMKFYDNNESNSIFKELEILPLDSLIKLRRGTFMWKLNNNFHPNPSSSWFKVNAAPVYNRRVINTYHLPQPRLNTAKRHHTLTATRLWNSDIPDYIKTSSSLNVFKSKYKTYLLSRV